MKTDYERGFIAGVAHGREVEKNLMKGFSMSDQIKSHVLSIINDLNHGYDGYGTDDEDGEYQDAFKYLEDVLDINWILNSDRTLKGVRLLVAFGGPNIWIDTSNGTVEGTWWGDSYTDTYDMDSEFARELDEALETLYAC